MNAPTERTPPPTADEAWIAATLQRLTLEEKIGQLLLVALFDLSPPAVPAALEALRQHHLGGVFHGYAAPHDLAAALDQLQHTSALPLLVAADYEIGAGWCVAGAATLPRPMNRGAGHSPDNEYKLGRIIAEQAAALGVHLTFSPVIDLNTHPLAPDVNIRAFGEDPAAVAALACAHIRGLQDHGLLACVKHFPGNGSTWMDQHITSAVIALSRGELDATSLAVYRAVFTGSAPAAVMVGHLEVPALTSETHPRSGRPLPASLSAEVITQLLRRELGFDGLAVSDAMNMGGVTSHFPCGEAAVRAVLAGMDMLLVFSGAAGAGEYEALLAAARSGRLSQNRLDEAVGRVLRAKSRLGLERRPRFHHEPAALDLALAPGATPALCEQVTRRGVTLLRNHGGVLPLARVAGKRVAVLSSFTPDEDTLAWQGQQAQILRDITPDLLRAHGATVEAITLRLHMKDAEIAALARNAAGYDVLFLNLFAIPTWGIGTLLPNKSTVRLLMGGLMGLDLPVVVTAFGDPYVFAQCPNAAAFLATFDESPAAQRAAVDVWLGATTTLAGRSPISCAPYFRRGDGIAPHPKPHSAPGSV